MALVSSAGLFVHPHLSLATRAFRSLPHKSVRQMGGLAFYMSLEGHPGNTICGPQCSLFEPCKIQTENRCSDMHRADSLKNLCVSACLCLPSAGFLLEELCIFYLSLEIRLDPDKSRGCTHRHSQTHVHTQMGLLLLLKSLQLWRERGEGQLGFAYVVERRNYISHKARRWK